MLSLASTGIGYKTPQLTLTRKATLMAVQHELDVVSASHRGGSTNHQRLAAADREVTVLEAGCGSLTYLNFGSRSRVIGIDISREQLDRNEVLDERILGDLETYSLAEDAYDAIVCWYVLTLAAAGPGADQLCPSTSARRRCSDRRTERAKPQGVAHKVQSPQISCLDLPASVPRSVRRQARSRAVPDHHPAVHRSCPTALSSRVTRVARRG